MGKLLLKFIFTYGSITKLKAPEQARRPAPFEFAISNVNLESDPATTFAGVHAKLLMVGHV